MDDRTVDDTALIAQKHGATVFPVNLLRDGVADFSQGRTQVFAKVEADWCLWIDSDDRIFRGTSLHCAHERVSRFFPFAGQC